MLAAAVMVAGVVLAAQQAAGTGPYRVVQRANVGGEGGWDYLYADAAGRRLYIPRGGPDRLSIYNLDTLEPAGEIAGVGGNGAAVDPKSGHGFTSGKPVTMFDTKTMKLIKTIDVGAAQPDGIVFDAFNQRVYIFSHPTKDATVIDAKDGTVLGTIDLGGVPEQGVRRRQGHALRRHAGRRRQCHRGRRQDDEGGGALSVRRQGRRCNGLALDAKNDVLFAACGASGNPPASAEADDGDSEREGRQVITTLPLAGSPMAPRSTRRRWRRSARTATAR